MELKIKEIAELKRDAVYFLRFNGIPDDRTSAYLNDFFRRIYETTGVTFIILNDSFEIIDKETNLQTIENIIEKVMDKRDQL
jgi:hypothetical protein